MDNNKSNIDQFLKDKFESFAPTPPDHIWENVRKNIDSRPYYFTAINKNIAATIFLLLLTGALWYFYPTAEELYSTTSETENPQVKNIIIESEITSEPETEISKDASDDDLNNEAVSNIKNNNVTNEASKRLTIDENIIENNKDIAIEKPSSFENQYSNTEYTIATYYINSLDLRKSFRITQDHTTNILLTDKLYGSRDELSIPKDVIETRANKISWKTGYYLSAELTVTEIDSVEILNSYSINIEPTINITKGFFIRTGIGLGYMRDRGYARIEYLLNEYMGSYEDVYEVSFDTTSGNVVPIYHTKTVDIYDTVRNISISNITNQYLYLQIPALLGYSFSKAGSPIEWYLYAGPAIFFNINSKIDNPEIVEEEADIIELKNNLPVRADNYFQLWAGIGIEYKLNKNFSVAVEPSYRRYLSNIYSNNNGPTSGFNLRLGLVYKMK